MNTLTKLYGLWTRHGTKLLSFTSGTIAAIAGTTGLIAEHNLKYYMGAIALLTFWRGFTNSAQTPAP